MVAKQSNEWMVWHGRQNQTCPARAKANKTQARAKASMVRTKGKSKNKGKGKQHGKKRKKGFHEMEGHDDKQETQSGQENTEWTDTSWDHADNWNHARLVVKRLEHGFVDRSCKGASGKTVAIDAAVSRTVQFNTWRKHFNERWFDDV